MKRIYTNWCQGMTSVLMAKATMWNSRKLFVPKLVYSVSVLLFKNILVWQNVLYFLHGLHIYSCIYIYRHVITDPLLIAL